MFTNKIREKKELTHNQNPIARNINELTKGCVYAISRVNSKIFEYKGEIQITA